MSRLCMTVKSKQISECKTINDQGIWSVKDDKVFLKGKYQGRVVYRKSNRIIWICENSNRYMNGMKRELIYISHDPATT